MQLAQLKIGLVYLITVKGEYMRYQGMVPQSQTFLKPVQPISRWWSNNFLKLGQSINQNLYSLWSRRWWRREVEETQIQRCPIVNLFAGQLSFTQVDRLNSLGNWKPWFYIPIRSTFGIHSSARKSYHFQSWGISTINWYNKFINTKNPSKTAVFELWKLDFEMWEIGSNTTRTNSNAKNQTSYILTAVWIYVRT